MRRCAALAAAIALCAAGGASAHPVVPAPQAPPGCDPLGTGNCLFPWPNDYFTKHGHLALTASMMPRNTAGVPIEPSDYNRADGFSPGQTIVLKVPVLSEVVVRPREEAVAGAERIAAGRRLRGRHDRVGRRAADRAQRDRDRERGAAPHGPVHPAA